MDTKIVDSLTVLFVAETEVRAVSISRWLDVGENTFPFRLPVFLCKPVVATVIANLVDVDSLG